MECATPCSSGSPKITMFIVQGYSVYVLTSFFWCTLRFHLRRGASPHASSSRLPFAQLVRCTQRCTAVAMQLPCHCRHRERQPFCCSAVSGNGLLKQQLHHAGPWEEGYSFNGGGCRRQLSPAPQPQLDCRSALRPRRKVFCGDFARACCTAYDCLGV